MNMKHPYFLKVIHSVSCHFIISFAIHTSCFNCEVVSIFVLKPPPVNQSMWNHKASLFLNNPSLVLPPKNQQRQMSSHSWSHPQIMWKWRHLLQSILKTLKRSKLKEIYLFKRWVLFDLTSFLEFLNLRLSGVDWNACYTLSHLVA